MQAIATGDMATQFSGLKSLRAETNLIRETFLKRTESRRLSSKVNYNPLLQLGSPEGYIKLKRDPGSLIPFLCGDTVKSVAEIGVQKSRFKSKNDLHKEPSRFYLSPGCPSILSNKTDTKSLANITSKIL